MSRIGIVIIGRNEGERFRRCLASTRSVAAPVVYVDSGSTDGSVEYARSEGAEVVDLDTSRPFTAARARNEGMDRLEQIAGPVDYVQFIDGDCELGPDWLATAVRWLDEHPQTAVVCGRLRERFPQATVYNYLADLDWNDAPGRVNSSGGIAMMRRAAVRDVGSWREDFVAGEEPDLCYRLRQAGWVIERLPDFMAYHDIQMEHFRQWWRRGVRSGYAYGLGLTRTGASMGAFRARKVVSIFAWGAGWPAAVVLCAALRWKWGVVGLVALLLVQVLRSALRERRHRESWKDSLASATACLAVKAPQCQGLVALLRDQRAGRRRGLIEYKTAGPVLTAHPVSKSMPATDPVIDGPQGRDDAAPPEVRCQHQEASR